MCGTAQPLQARRSAALHGVDLSAFQQRILRESTGRGFTSVRIRAPVFIASHAKALMISRMLQSTYPYRGKGIRSHTPTQTVACMCMCMCVCVCVCVCVCCVCVRAFACVCLRAFPCSCEDPAAYPKPHQKKGLFLGLACQLRRIDIRANKLHLEFKGRTPRNLSMILVTVPEFRGHHQNPLSALL